MKKINWKLRFKNKATLLTLLGMIVAFIYQILSFFDVVPRISEDTIMTVILFVLNFLVSFGVLVDPTTKGIGDSKQALTYQEPRVDDDYANDTVPTVVSDNKTYVKDDADTEEA